MYTISLKDILCSKHLKYMYKANSILTKNMYRLVLIIYTNLCSKAVFADNIIKHAVRGSSINAGDEGGQS